VRRCQVEGLEFYDALTASPAVCAGDLVFVSGQFDSDSRGEVRSPGDVVAQAAGAFDSLERVLEACGGGLEDLVDVMTFHRDIRDVEAVMDVARERLGPHYPAWTPVGMSGAHDPDVLVLVRGIAHLGREPKRCFTPSGAGWMARHPMSAACGRGPLLFVSGQAGLDAGGEPLAPGDHAAGSRLAYAGARECLEAAGGSMADVIDICSFHLDPRGMVASERVHMEEWQGVEPGAAACWTAIGTPALFKRGMTSQYRFIADLSEGPRIGRGGLGRRGQRDHAGRHPQPGPLRARAHPRGGRAPRLQPGQGRRDHLLPQGSARVVDRHGGGEGVVRSRARAGVDRGGCHRPVEPGLPARDLRPGRAVSAGFPASVRTGDLVFASADPAVGGSVSGDARGQAELALDALERALADAGAGLEDLVGVLSFHLDVREIDDVLAVAARRLGARPPAWTAVMAAALPGIGTRVALSAVAVIGAGDKRCVIPETIAWWRALGVSAGCRKGDLIVIAGQYGSDADGNVNTPGDHRGQARNALNRVKEIAGRLGAGLGDVIELVSFHQDPRGIAPGAELYRDEFLPDLHPADPPAWTAAGMPALYRLGMLGQYQAIADAGHAGLSLVCLAAGPNTAESDAAAQAHAAWDAVERGLAEAGAGVGDVVAITSLHLDVRELGAVEDVLRVRCGDDLPVWSAAGVTGFADERHRHSFRVVAKPGRRSEGA
jgi:enamine deaminase RidA (YjgF/YER057c/UK114 family)